MISYAFRKINTLFDYFQTNFGGLLLEKEKHIKLEDRSKARRFIT